MTLLTGFRPVKPSDFFHLQKLYASADGPPRFWRSPSYLAANSANLIGFRNSCTVLVRRKVLHGNPICYLLMPPFGKIKDVQYTIEEFADTGINTKLSLFDADYYGIQCKPAVNNVEFYYTGLQSIPSGTKGKDLRYGVNRIQKLVDSGLVRIYSGHSLGFNTSFAIECAKRWYKQKHGVSGTERIIKAFSEEKTVNSKFVNAVLDGNNKMLALSLTEVIGPNQVAIIVRIKDYEDPFAKGIIGGLHAMDCIRWDGCQLTIGSAVGVKGLEAHKSSLGKVEEVQIYDSIVSRKLTIESYKSLLPVMEEEGLFPN